MSYAQPILTPAQANARMGWSPQKVRAYWDARARACRQMGDEGACLAQAARHVPITLGGLGALGQQPSAADVANIAAVAAQLIANPDQTMRVQGPRIVAALDQHVVGPVIGAATQRATPYLLRYLGPPLLMLYLMTGLSTWFSYQVLLSQKGGIARNARRKRRRRSKRRTSRR